MAGGLGAKLTYNHSPIQMGLNYTCAAVLLAGALFALRGANWRIHGEFLAGVSAACVVQVALALQLDEPYWHGVTLLWSALLGARVGLTRQRERTNHDWMFLAVALLFGVGLGTADAIREGRNSAMARGAAVACGFAATLLMRWALRPYEGTTGQSPAALELRGRGLGEPFRRSLDKDTPTAVANLDVLGVMKAVESRLDEMRGSSMASSARSSREDAEADGNYYHPFRGSPLADGERETSPPPPPEPQSTRSSVRTEFDDEEAVRLLSFAFGDPHPADHAAELVPPPPPREDLPVQGRCGGTVFLERQPSSQDHFRRTSTIFIEREQAAETG